MILLLTSSGDGTSDRLSQKLGDQIFRLNFDQLPEFKISFSCDEWNIENPVGRRISSSTAKAVLWWKAFVAAPEGYERFLKAEAKYFFWELYSWFRSQGKIKGNPPDFHNRFGKVQICKLAQSYFLVPKTLVTYQLLNEQFVPIENRIVKSLSSEMLENNKSLFTTDVSNKKLDPKFPWFIQEKVTANFDLTMFVVGAKVFGFSRDRSKLEGLDWRSEQNFNMKSDEWLPFTITDEVKYKIHSLNKDLGIEWGRYDFLVNANDEIIFLEFNPNGQWVFLDYQNKYGLLDSVVEYLKN
jgi:hypothetical protein